jgi:hypothetical protein
MMVKKFDTILILEIAEAIMGSPIGSTVRWLASKAHRTMFLPLSLPV